MVVWGDGGLGFMVVIRRIMYIYNNRTYDGYMMIDRCVY